MLPLKVFLGGTLLYLLAVLPFLSSHGGLFFYYGDYNVQQVPFLIFAHRAVRQGRFFWNPLVDLGGNMGGAFSFYLWGSPFFWLTIPFPEAWLPYMTPYLMALKFGTASATACAWIRTQTRTDGAAVLGSLLYAFSGFQACNIVFQHFHDSTAFFPLYLLAFDRYVEELQRRGVRRRTSGLPGWGAVYGFILMTAWMAVINYYFFFGQVLFLVLYYLVRTGIRRVRAEGIRTAVQEVLQILAAGAAGLALSAFFLVQSIGGILGNTRISKVLEGYDLLVYPDAVTPLAILKSFFMVPDLIARGTLFSSDHIRNGSLAFYLPCFAMSGVFAFFLLRKKSWKKTLLLLLAVMAFVPVLCAAFSAFNSNFYVRWFYMPVLLCACMTAEALEEDGSAAFTKGCILSFACTGLFLLFCFLPSKENGTWTFTAVGENRRLLMTEIEGTLIGAAALCAVLFLKRRRGALFAGAGFLREPEPVSGLQADAEQASDQNPDQACRRGPGVVHRLVNAGNLCIFLTAVCCVTSTMAVLHNGSSLISYTGFEKWKRQMLTEKPLLQDISGEGDGQVPFSRVETDSTSTNYEMVWGFPTMHCFESTVHPSIFTWYRGIGMIRTVESTLPLERIGARALMSVRYYIENTLVKPDNSYTDQGGMPGYDLLNEENGYKVYETENYIPMGISFDSCMTEENYDLLKNGTVSDRVLVKNIVLSEEMVKKYGGLLEEDTDTDPGEMPYWEFSGYCRDRAASACTSFGFDTNGFHAEAEMERDNLVLFSIPYDEGFRVTVDGRPAELERADFGLCAVFVPEGRHEIRAVYLPKGFVPAAALSLLTAAGLLVSVFAARRRRADITVQTRLKP